MISEGISKRKPTKEQIVKEVRKEIRLAIGRSGDYEARRQTLLDAGLSKNGNVRPIRPINDVGAEEILNLKGNGWKIAIINPQKSSTFNKQYKLVIWEGGEKE